MKKLILLIPIFLSIMFFSASSLAEVAVIVNANNPINKLSKTEVKRLFLGKLKRFPGGAKAQPLDLRVGTKERSTFYSKVVRKSDAQLKSYWSTMIFSGRGVPPKEFNDVAEAVEWVAKNKN
ncbi:MAG: phosphate ABC transporter substrate-binding protein, partial [Gammaproteobacteria bacterium]|nr:phosphate ABC transporter substrate-binding protein [Gammaproteobacteria bacterium]